MQQPQPIAQMLQRSTAPCAPQSVNNQSQPVPSAWIIRLFDRFGEIYGHLWNSTHSEGAVWESKIITWQHGLVGLTGEDIRQGLQECAVHSPFPPSVAKFREFAGKASQGRTNHDAYKPYTTTIQRLLPPVEIREPTHEEMCEHQISLFVKLKKLHPETEWLKLLKFYNDLKKKVRGEAEFLGSDYALNREIEKLIDAELGILGMLTMF